MITSYLPGLKTGMDFRGLFLKTGVDNYIFWSELGSGFEEPGGTKSVENDLRPISLTSPIAKVLEGFSAESLITSVFNKLDNKQFALPGRSTTQALIFFMHPILEALDSCGRYIRIFFSDFSKGFDLVDHIVLLSELNNLDVDPHLIRWIAAFLTNRSQRVRIGNSLSPPVGLNGGTPHGTKLAPLLFCILVNGMAAKCKSN